MTTKRTITLAAVGAVATVSTVAISMSSWIGASAAVDPAGDVIRLHIGSDSVASFTYGDEVQLIQPGRSSCDVQSPAGTVINLGSTPTPRSKPGIANFGIGVKASPSSGNGNPCAQTDTTESLILTPGSSAALSGRSFEKVRFDLEVTGNSIVKLTLGNGTTGPSQEFKLQTGTRITPAEQTELDSDESPNEVETGSSDPIDACAAANSSNPNSGGSDNCLWTVDPDFTFTQVTLTATESGTVALEGSADFANDSEHDSLLFLAPGPVANNDEVSVFQNHTGISPKQSVSIDVLANDDPSGAGPLAIKSGSVVGAEHGTAVIVGNTISYTPADDFVGQDTFTYQATEGNLTSNQATVTVNVGRTLCGGQTIAAGDPESVHAQFTLLTLGVCKPYDFDVDDQTGVEGEVSSVLFQPVGVDQVNYRGAITFIRSESEVVDPTDGIELLLSYDEDPNDADDTFRQVPVCDSPVFEAGLVTAADIPDGHSWCIASVTAVARGTDELVTTWQLWGLDDPKYQ